MSTAPLTLEDFSQSTQPLTVIDGDQFEAAKLDAYDKGHAAGWEDATAALNAQREKDVRALEARMEELGFTFHEARAHVMKSLHPLLSAIVQTAVPRILHDTLGHRLEQAFQEIADRHPDAEVIVHTSPHATEHLKRCLADHTRFPTRIEPDETLDAGIIQMRLGTAAREIDLTTIETTLTDALNALETLNEETLSHV